MVRFEATAREDRGDTWKDLIDKRVALMSHHHGLKNKTCCGIDFRKSARFMRLDVARCTLLLDCFDDANDIIGFAMIKTNLPSNSIYIVLMTSFRPGTGRMLMQHASNLPGYAQRYIVLRSTDHALGFYLKLGFRLFNWHGTEGYVTASDGKLTDLLRSCSQANARAGVLSELRRRRWIDSEAEEWPLLIQRHAYTPSPSIRQSPRLKNMSEACTRLD